MPHVALFEPEIPPNTGNIIRLCANSGAFLHIIQPCAFELDDKKLRRAGLDYHEWASIVIHDDLKAFISSLKPDQRIFACSTKGSIAYHEVEYHDDDILLFGPESRGLPIEVLNSQLVDSVICIPMKSGSRSLNLSNAAAIILYECLRQTGFNFDQNL